MDYSKQNDRAETRKILRAIRGEYRNPHLTIKEQNEAGIILGFCLVAAMTLLVAAMIWQVVK